MFKQVKDDWGVYLQYNGNDPEDMIEAWDITLKKWELVVQEVDKGNLIGDGGAGTCGLCMLYNHRERECAGCPIPEQTNKIACSGTQLGNYCVALIDESIPDAKKYSRLMLKQLRDIHKTWKDQQDTP